MPTLPFHVDDEMVPLIDVKSFAHSSPAPRLTSGTAGRTLTGAGEKGEGAVEGWAEGADGEVRVGCGAVLSDAEFKRDRRAPMITRVYH